MSPINLDPSNLIFVEDLLHQWEASPDTVPVEWRNYFERLQHTPAPSSNAVSTTVATESDAAYAYKQSRINHLLWAHRSVGYLHANLNPLHGYVTPGLQALRESAGGDYRELSLKEFDLSDEDLDVEYYSSPHFTPKRGPLRDIIRKLRDTYCSAIGVEFLHIQDREMRDWIMENIETNNNTPPWSDEQKRTIQEDLIRAEEFEHFLHGNFIGQKRFSLEGSESLIPALHYLIKRAAYDAGIEEVVFGMTHRGRLNVLVNVLQRPPAGIFATFSSEEKAFTYMGSGDVRYHLGFSLEHVTPDGSTIHVGLVANASHLEAVDPIVEGKARGIQRRRGDHDRKRVIPLLIHGDVSFTGQGVVAEMFNLSQLRGYKTGGTIHIIINNQIGFTTASRDARSTFFPTDIAKSLPVPIFHVNGDYPEHVVRAIDLAMRFRQEFAFDAIVDIFCYRKYGHNEADDPTLTHPVMYETIKNMPSVATQYGEILDQAGTYGNDEQSQYRDAYRTQLTDALAASQTHDPVNVDAAFQSDEWRGFTHDYDHSPVKTGVTEKHLTRIARNLCDIPSHLEFNTMLKRVIADRRRRFEQGTQIDWASAEALAFATLLVDGIPIRLSGEDSSRGTFAQRHAIWWYRQEGDPKPYCPFEHLSESQARFTAYDSPLSEFSVLGFEYGNALAQPNMLTIWEAQFGDFANGAQVIIDQFIAAAESKWDRSNGLVMLLPHGYSGQGPEHSSAHLERFLQLCAEGNMQVCNMTTPAQYFHVLRRQLMRNFRKPLIIMAPKSLLRHKAAVSRISEFSTGHFREVLDDPDKLTSAETVLLCAGQIFYDLLERRAAAEASHAAIVRLEQLYPFPEKQLHSILKRYRKAMDIVWVQEEPRNRGGWTFIRERIDSILGTREIRYVGRKSSASAATGSAAQHNLELETLLDAAFQRHVLRQVG